MIIIKRTKKVLKKKLFKIVSEILIGTAGLTVGSSLTISGLAPVGVMCASSISFLSSISTLITNGYFSKIKIRYANLKDWINVNTLLFEKILKHSMIDKKIDEKEANELTKKNIFNHYLDEKSEILKNTQPRVGDVFGDFLIEASISPAEVTKLNNFSVKMM